jgi:hypothetical protein
MPINRRFESDNRVIIETLEAPRSRLVDSTVLVDLRRKPRYDTRFPGEATSANDNRAYVTITNLSLSGLRLEAAEQNLATLLPVTSPGGEHHPVTLTVCFAVPGLTAQPGDIRVRCKTVYAHRGPHGSCQVGVRFTTFDEGREALSSYIALREAER